MPPIRRPVLERRREEIARVESVTAQDTWIKCIIAVEGVGESQVEIPFPVRFSEEPFPILGGGILVDGEPKKFNFPTVQMMVVDWIMEGSLYRGAKVTVVATGHASQRLHATCAFTGIALTNGGDSNE